MNTIDNKQRVLNFYKLIVGQRRSELIPEFVLEDYKQHSSMVKQGRAGITDMINYLKTLPMPPTGAKSPIIRAIQEGDLVVTHLDIEFMSKRMVVIDLFKLKDGMLAEHWDAVQEIPPQTGLAITATNGTTEISKTASAEISKRVVSQFYNAIIDGDIPAGLIKADYVEHNSDITDFGKGLIGYLMQDPARTIQVLQLIAEGDFVVVQLRYKLLNKAYMRYEIFRIEEDKIAEHWSVEQVI